MTGLATGPHLDYRMMRNGAFVDPLRVQSPPAEPIPAEERAAFEQVRSERLILLRRPSPGAAHRLHDPIRTERRSRMHRQNILRLLLVFVPVSFYLGMTHASPTWVFLVACLAILPLAGLMGEATEHLTHHTGPGIGGLLNASFGNAAELIIAFMALRAGETEIVKASLTGSIIGNILMVLGLAMLLGGWKRKELVFSRLAAESGSSMMVLAVVALVIPAIYAQVTNHTHPEHLESISLDISYVLIATYAASLVFSLKTHKRLFAAAEGSDEDEPHGAVWSVGKSMGVLLAAAVLVGFVSEFLVHAVDEAGKAMGLGKVFMGVVVVAIVGNAAEHSTAVVVAMKGKMDLALGIAMGSSMQIALFVAPVLVIAGHLMGDPPGARVHRSRGGGGDALGGRGGPPDPRRQDQLVRGRSSSSPSTPSWPSPSTSSRSRPGRPARLPGPGLEVGRTLGHAVASRAPGLSRARPAGVGRGQRARHGRPRRPQRDRGAHGGSPGSPFQTDRHESRL